MEDRIRVHKQFLRFHISVIRPDNVGELFGILLKDGYDLIKFRVVAKDIRILIQQLHAVEFLQVCTTGHTLKGDIRSQFHPIQIHVDWSFRCA